MQLNFGIAAGGMEIKTFLLAFQITEPIIDFFFLFFSFAGLETAMQDSNKESLYWPGGF